MLINGTSKSWSQWEKPGWEFLFVITKGIRSVVTQHFEQSEFSNKITVTLIFINHENLWVRSQIFQHCIGKLEHNMSSNVKQTELITCTRVISVINLAQQSRGRLCIHEFRLFMAVLWNRAGHYIFALWFLLSFFLSSFFPCLISAAADWISTILRHMVQP